MLTITVWIAEQYDELKEEFIPEKELSLTLEHSLVSLSKWESTWCVPFMSKVAKTDEQTLDYIRCMTITKNVDPDVYRFLSEENIKQVKDYIDAPMTATVLHNDKTNVNRQVITSEKIYYWMIALNIPYKYEKWHLNRLLTLINVCDIENRPPKKMNKNEIMRRNRETNEARKKMLNTNG